MRRGPAPGGEQGKARTTMEFFRGGGTAYPKDGDCAVEYRCSSFGAADRQGPGLGNLNRKIHFGAFCCCRFVHLSLYIR